MDWRSLVEGMDGEYYWNTGTEDGFDPALGMDGAGNVI